MSARSWLVIFAGTLIMPVSQATVDSVAKPSDATYLSADAQPAGQSETPAAIEPASGAAYEQLPIWNSQNCQGSSCLDLRVLDLRIAAIDRQFGVNSSSGAMSLLDAVLMVLFAGGLIAYQLARKQRILRQSSLFAASL
jgi:hypothetical protein